MSDDPKPVILADDPLAPYMIAPAWKAGGLLFLSGQASIGADGSIVGVGDIDAQIA
jgi:enamine deaminase RidA (YjgF/YER057c/UK114 family)